jgi:hypothetical protein
VSEPFRGLAEGSFHEFLVVGHRAALP